jgi:PAS domain S-box-containing protein
MADVNYQESLINLSREALDNLPFGAYVIDKEGTILFFNQEMAKISGVEEGKEVEGQNVFEVPSYQKYGLIEFIKQGLNGQPFTIKGIQYVSHVGKKESFRDYYGIPIKNNAGEVEKLLCLVEDTTRRRELEEQVIADLREKERLLEQLGKK